MRSLRVLLFALVLSLPVASAFAQEEPTDARGLFQRGVELSDEQRWGEAVEYFRRSRAIEDRPSTMYNMALALQRMGRYSEEIEVLTQYLASSDPRRDAQTRAEAERMMNVARNSRARVDLTVSPASTTISIDGEPVEGEGTRRELQLDPGQRGILFEADGYTSQTLRLSLLAGSEQATTVDLAPIAETQPAPTPQETAQAGTTDHGEVGATAQPLDAAPRDEDDEGGVTSSPVFWAVLGVVVVGAGVGVGVALASGGDDASPYGGSSGVVLTY